MTAATRAGVEVRRLGPDEDGRAAQPATIVGRLLFVLIGLLAGFATIGAQMVRIGMSGQALEHIAVTTPVATNWSRPDILDRSGRLFATDIATPSLFADPALIVDPDEVVERLRELFPDVDARALRRQLADDDRRFVWIRRGLTPAFAQRIHDLGLPGLAFRNELKRVYPAGQTAAHVLGQSDVDNKGLSGLERYIDDEIGAAAASAAPVRLSIDLAVQHAVREEVRAALAEFRARAAAALVMEARTGEIVAAVSLPDYDPNQASGAEASARADRIAGGVYELGSIFKIMTLAMLYDAGLDAPGKLWDARQPLTVAGHTIDDFHGQRRQLTAREVFLHSSNIGAGLMAQAAGAQRQRAFLERVGLIQPIKTEAGPVAPPLLPQRWGESETVTISYGHGIAVAPLQFAAATAALVNGGYRVTPTFLAGRGGHIGSRDRVVSEEVSGKVRELLRLNAMLGTGRRAQVPGLDVGGKTGTADLPKAGRYSDHAVITSFVAAFPISAPRYVTLVSLFEPKATPDTQGQVTASHNAAPLTGRIIARIAPLLDALAPMPMAAAARARFDGAAEGR